MQRGVHKSVCTIGQTSLLPAGQTATEAATDADVPAGVVEVVDLGHELGALLLDLEVRLEVVGHGAAPRQVDTPRPCTRGEGSITQGFTTRRIRSGRTKCYNGLETKYFT